MFNPTDVIRPVGYSRTELGIRNPPVERVVVMKQNTGEFTGGIEVGPIDGVTGMMEKGLKGRIERSQMSKVWWLL